MDLRAFCSWNFRLLVGAALAATGCQNFAPPHQAWTEAEVVGRVVDAATHEPLEKATVSRVRSQEIGDAYPADKGATQMQQRPTLARSETDGRFKLDGQRTAYLFLESFPSYAVILRIQRSGYETVQRQFTNVFRGTNGQVPRVETGDIGLARSP